MKYEDDEDEDVQRINIWRSQALSDSLRQFCKTSFNVEKLLKVCFIVEEAVDAGGPRREFFISSYKKFLQNLDSLVAFLTMLLYSMML